jgi:hypothetical protein
MIKKPMFLIVLLVFFAQCAQVKSKSTKQTPKSGLQIEEGTDQPIKGNTGLTIEYGPNLGTTHTDPLGTRYFYVHSTAIITNDSIIPIHLQLALSNEYEFPTFCGDTNKYKVFLLPEKLTPDTATVYNNIVNGQHDFLNTPLDNPNTLNKTLNSGEYCVVTIGVLIPKPANCAAVPRAVFLHDNIGLYHTCDWQLPAYPNGGNQAIITNPQLEIGVKLEYYNQRKFISPEDGCSVIPFGQISYPEY